MAPTSRWVLAVVTAALACGDAPTQPPFLDCSAVVLHAVGTTQTGALGTSDCRLSGRPVDYYALRIDTLTTVRLYLSSQSFDTYLVLFATTPAVPITADDNGATGTNSYLGQGLEAGDYVIAVQGAADTDLGPYSLSSKDTVPAAPTLLSPPRDHVVYQYADAPFCDGQYGFQIRYEWTTVPGALSYHIYAIGPNAAGPALSTHVSDTTFTDTSCLSWVGGPNRTGWTWWIAAAMPDGTRLVSAHRHYDFTARSQPQPASRGTQLDWLGDDMASKRSTLRERRPSASPAE
jgi:hypothetical protein